MTLKPSVCRTRHPFTPLACSLAFWEQATSRAILAPSSGWSICLFYNWVASLEWPLGSLQRGPESLLSPRCRPIARILCLLHWTHPSSKRCLSLLPRMQYPDSYSRSDRSWPKPHDQLLLIFTTHRESIGASNEGSEVPSQNLYSGRT